MRKFKGTKIGKRILSVALAAGMVLAMLPAAGFGLSAQAENAKGNMQYYSSNGKKVVRGAVKDLTELPQYGRDDWEELSVGTARRPFTVLEIVPYMEFAEFGYLIGGCEPVDIKSLQGDSGAVNYVNSFKACTMQQITDRDIFFFTDEAEGKKEYYFGISTDTWNNMTHKTDGSGQRYHETVRGYYEVVKMGEGSFKIERDPVTNKDKIVKVGDMPSERATANIVWHSLHSNVNGHGDITAEYGFGQTLESTPLAEIGDTLYTTRISTDEDYVINARYYYHSYVNDEVFLYDTVGLTKEEADAYSAVVKVITPAELNGQLDWIKYADLIYLSCKSHGGENAAKWNLYNQYGVNTTTVNRQQDAKGFFDNDLSYNAVMKILDKNTAASNYAALLIDNTLYDGFASLKKSVTVQPYDFNLDPIKKNGSNLTYNDDGIDNNLYKLILMVVGQNPVIVKQVFSDYLTVDSGKANDPTAKIKCTLQTGLAQTHWSDHIFQLVDKSLFAAYNAANGGYKSVKEYLTDPNNKKMLWDAYNYSANFHTERQYVQNRTYTYNGDTAIAQLFRRGNVVGPTPSGWNESQFDNTFTDFDDYVHTDQETIDIWERNRENGNITNTSTLTGATAPPSAALRYILGLGHGFTPPSFGGYLKVLDIEPSVGVNSDYTSDWQLKKSYIQMLVPKFTGTIEITHMTMNSFVGRTNDLNSDYNMIYLGSDGNAFWQDANGRTDFTDNSMDGWVYFHIGDYGKAGRTDKGYGPRTANFIAGVDDSAELLRYAGNDITKVKADRLKEFMDAGFPIIADPALYTDGYVDGSSNISSFLATYNAENASNPLNPNPLPEDVSKKGVFNITQIDEIDDLVRNSMTHVTFVETPTRYDESNYLPTYGSMARLNFKFEVPTDEYSYRIYVDQNKNGKFEATEVILSRKANLSNSVHYDISSARMGLVQWRIEVYKTDNPNQRDSREGCSAIKRLAGAEKEKIKVLQITPEGGVLNADLTSNTFSRYYDALDAFKIEVDKITWPQFENYFVGTGFKFDMGKPISSSNPASDVLNAAETPVGKSVGAGQNLNDYNMIIVGFSDSYGGDDMSDKNGAAEYLYYFAENGRSILFTHDNTSLYNEPGAGVNTAKMPGYTANTMLRDILGMNRYGITSKQLSNFRAGLAEDLAQYRANRVDAGLKYDTTDKAEKQAFTLTAMRKMGQGASGYKNPYKWMVKNPANGNDFSGADGYSDNNCQTTLAMRMNVGQITEYPFNISEGLPVATTHPQWYQLNMEDPEVTVWYTLDNSKTFGYNSYSMSDCGEVLAASPQDAANTYYIYSKGNIFYSGVGHSSVSGDMEVKLFINTMIAAYRAIPTPPSVVVTNQEAFRTNPAPAPYEDCYTIRVPQEFNFNGSNYDITDFGGDMVKVTFMPIDNSYSNNLRTRIYYADVDAANVSEANSIYVIYPVDGGNPIYRSTGNPEEMCFFENLEHGHEYYFLYPKSSLRDHPNLVFETKSDRSNKAGFTLLRILAQPLFKLD